MFLYIILANLKMKKFEKDRSEKHDACGTDVAKIASSVDHVSCSAINLGTLQAMAVN
jgi:hypothetical protein